MTEPPVAVRHSIDEDIHSITEIYAREVLTGLASFEVEPPDTAEMAQRRQKIVQAGFPYLVATHNEKVVGYASLSVAKHTALAPVSYTHLTLPTKA